jgi:hypothetical protein
MMTSVENHTVILIDPEYVPQNIEQPSAYQQSSSYCWSDSNSLSFVTAQEDASELSFIDTSNSSSPFRFDESGFDIKFQSQYATNSVTENGDFTVSISQDNTLFQTKPRKWWVVSKKVREFINSLGSISPVSSNSDVDYLDIDLEKQEVVEEETPLRF